MKNHPTTISGGQVSGYQLDSGLGGPAVSASRFAPRHAQGGNLAFCDGHAEWQHRTNAIETRPGLHRGFAIWPGGQIIWTADPYVSPYGADHPHSTSVRTTRSVYDPRPTV